MELAINQTFKIEPVTIVEEFKPVVNSAPELSEPLKSTLKENATCDSNSHSFNNLVEDEFEPEVPESSLSQKQTSVTNSESFGKCDQLLARTHVKVEPETPVITEKSASRLIGQNNYHAKEKCNKKAVDFLIQNVKTEPGISEDVNSRAHSEPLVKSVFSLNSETSVCSKSKIKIEPGLLDQSTKSLTDSCANSRPLDKSGSSEPGTSKSPPKKVKLEPNDDFIRDIKQEPLFEDPLGNNSIHSADNSSNIDQIYKCPKCPLKFEDFSTLHNHLLSHDTPPEVSVKAPIYAKTVRKPMFTSRKIHSSKMPSPVKSQTVQNAVPEKRTISKSINSYAKSFFKLQNGRSYTGEKPFACEKCGARFLTCETLKMHEVIHIQARPYKCKICSMQFSELICLKRHQERKNHYENT